MFRFNFLWFLSTLQGYDVNDSQMIAAFKKRYMSLLRFEPPPSHLEY